MGEGGMKERFRHPSTQISDDIVREIAYRVYLRRLEPPMTPAESLAESHIARPIAGRNGGKDMIENDASRRKNSGCYLPLVREMLRASVDLGLIEPGPAGLLGS